jgi:hypothetical protein
MTYKVRRISPRFGTLWQIAESTSRSSANVTVRRGTLDSLLMSLGGIGPRLFRQSNTTRALLGNLILGIIVHPLNVV